MAPQYAPSLRSRLAPLLFLLQLGFIIIYAFYVEIDCDLGGITFNALYPGECGGLGGGRGVQLFQRKSSSGLKEGILVIIVNIVHM